MEDQNTIIDEHLLERKLIGVWELVGDSSRKIVEGYALSLEGYFLEIETMLDGTHSRAKKPLKSKI